MPRDLLPDQLFSPSLLIALGVLFLCQAFKVIYYSLRDSRPRFELFLSPGGMPSAHSASVSALTLSVGLRSGSASEVFSVSLVFSGIIVYDALRLRGTVQLHSRVIREIMGRLPLDSRRPSDLLAEEIPEMVGHTLPEVIAGVLVGCGLGYLGTRLF